VQALKSLEGTNPPARFFWKKGGGGGWVEQRERRGMSTGVDKRYPPTEPQDYKKKAWATHHGQTAQMFTPKYQHSKEG